MTGADEHDNDGDSRGSADPGSVAMLDQHAAHLRDEVRLVVTYWRALRARRVPWPLAFALVRDWHAAWRGSLYSGVEIHHVDFDVEDG